MNKLHRLGSRLMSSSTRPILQATTSIQLVQQGYDGKTRSSVGILAGLALLVSVAVDDKQSTASCAAPVYRNEEVAKHKTADTGVWVTYKGGVYDITKFVVNHPGGSDKIMLAAGGSIEGFWKLYTQHTNSKMAMNLLSEMRIGDMHPEDIAAAAKTRDDKDPYKDDPDVNPVQVTHVVNPRNAEAPGLLLTESWITPPGLFFVRNHHPVPHYDAEAVKNYEFEVAGVTGPHSSIACTFSLQDLKKNYKKATVVSSIQCGGNRRAEMNPYGKTFGCPWEAQAISTAEWGGARMSDVLADLGVTRETCERDGVKHLIMVGSEDMQASIPISKALDPYGDSLLAYEMNGKDIPESHGAPLRGVVPGIAGVRNVKWIKKLILSKEEATGPWQRGIAYKMFGPSTKTVEGLEVEAFPSLQEQPVQSAIMAPKAGQTFDYGDIITLKGYAYSGGGRGIIRVDVSVDGGSTWKTATLTDGKDQPLDRAWAWTIWEADMQLPERDENAPAGSKQAIELICKATDASHNVQPDTVQGIWNLRGINNNAWYRVRAELQDAAEEGDDDE